jgi:predicted anti-sigma-YlaC factor YlaD
MLGSLSEYLDGELPECLCAEIEHHLKACGDCRVMVDTLRKTVVLYRELGHQDLPVDAKERLYAVLNLDRTCKE